MERFAGAWLPRRPVIVAHDVLLACLALPFAFLLLGDFAIDAARFEFLAYAVPVAGIIAHLAFTWVGTYRVLWRYATIRDFLILVAGATIAVLGFVLVMFLWDRLAAVPRAAPVMQWLILVVSLCGARLGYSLCRATLPGASETGGSPTWEPVLLIGAGQGAALVTQMLEVARPSGWHPIGILDERMTPGHRIGQVPILGRPGDFRRVLGRLSLQGMRPHRIVITAPHHELGLEAIEKLLQEASAERIPVDNLPELLCFHRECAGQAAEERRQLVVAEAVERRSFLAVKRLADIAVSLAVLLVLAPVLAVIGLALRASIGSPVLFRQVRPGRGRVPFVLYKFRTMQEMFGPDGRPLDDRLRTSRLGWLLRRTRLDELPQFWNVLIGDMSIVGPRPLLDRDLPRLPDGRLERCTVAPGITGWAQVHGGQQLGPEDKLALDLWYVRHASLALDLKIALLTLRMMIWGERVNEVEVERVKAALASV